MSASVVSYHLPALVQDFIQIGSKKMKIPKGKFLTFLIEDYQKTKEENEELKAYFEMASDKEFLEEQMKESEEDLQSECAHNPDFVS